MSGKPCKPGCTCRKHKWTDEHRANMSASASSSMQKYWRRRRLEQQATTVIIEYGVFYIPAGWVCKSCGAIVQDKQLHNEWHQETADAALGMKGLRA